MANVKISQLPQTSVVCNNALIPLVQNGVTCSTYACNLGGGGGIFVAGTGCNSSIRDGVGNTASALYSSALGGNANCNIGVNSTINTGGLNIIGCYDLTAATCLTTSSYVYCANASTNSLYIYGDYTADLQVGNCIGYFNCYDNRVYSGVITCSTYSGNYTEIKGICAGSCSGYICSTIRNFSCAISDSFSFGNNVDGYSNIAECSINVKISGNTNCTYSGSCDSSILSGCRNSISNGDNSSIASGSFNTISNNYSFIGAGYNNNLLSFRSFIGAGASNTVSGGETFIGSGAGNTASGCFSFIAGGPNNTASGYGTSIGGGRGNVASGVLSAIAGGYDNSSGLCGQYTFVGGGRCNTASFNYDSVLGGTQNLACGSYSAVIGGVCNSALGPYSIVGGFVSIAYGEQSISLGNNNISCFRAVSIGGLCNTASGNYSSIIGGKSNISSGLFSSVMNGCGNNSCGNYSSISGGRNNIASCSFSTLSGGYSNIASGILSFVGGGRFNTSSECHSAILSGCGNTSSFRYSTIINGVCNISNDVHSIVLSGCCNISSGGYSTILNGFCSTASCFYSTILNGKQNTSSGYVYSTILNGLDNISSACYSTIVNGRCNTASGNYSSIIGGVGNNTCGFANAMIVGSNLNATQACTTFTNCLSADNLIVGSGVCVGANKVLVDYPLSYGQFSQSGTLTATLANTEYLIPFDTIKFNNGVSVVSNTQITMANAGVYKIQFSSVFTETGSSASVSLWFKKNGTPIANSNTIVTVKNNENYVAAWDYLESFTAGQYIELAWSSTQANSTQMVSVGTLSSPTRPATPAVIVTIIRVA